MGGRALTLLRALVLLIGVALANAGVVAQAQACEDLSPSVVSATHDHGAAEHGKSGPHQTKPCCAACSAMHDQAPAGEAAPLALGVRLAITDVAAPAQSRPGAVAPPPREA